MKDSVQRPMSLWLCVALTLLSLILHAGCGGCNSLDRRRRELEEAQRQFALKEAEEEKKQREEWQKTMAARRAEEEKRKAAEKEKEAARRKQQEEEEQAKVPQLPADVSQWTKEHFLQALATGNPQLLKALENLAKAPQRTTAEAELLISLLAPPQQRNKPKPTVTSVSNHPSRFATFGSIDRGALVRSVAAALAANGTDSARKALAELLSGQADAVDRQSAAEGALAALLREGSPESQQLVFQAITAPIELHDISSGSARAAMDSARQRMIAMVGAEGSRQLRSRLARWAVEEAESGAVREAVVKMLCEPNWLNLEAQMLLYSSPLCDGPARTSLERQMLAHSSEALGLLLELGFGDATTNAQSRTGGSQNIPSSLGGPTEKHYVVARTLWHPRFAELLELRMQASGSLREASSLVDLAVTIPTSAMRDRLRRMLNRQWWEGPQVLGGGSDARGPAEPGLVAMLKLLQRQNATGSSGAAGRPGRLASNGRSSASGVKSGSQSGDNRSATGAADAWNRYLESVVRGLCRRCHLAALQQATAAHRSGADIALEMSPQELPFPQFPGTQTEAVFRIDWPGKHAVELPELADDFLRLRYVRMEVTARPTAAAAYYRRQMTQYQERPWPDGLWLDSLQLLPDKAAARSVDVVLTLPRGAAGSPSDTLPLTIELLVIEIQDSGQGSVRTK